MLETHQKRRWMDIFMLKTDRKRATLCILISLFLTFTLAYTFSTDAIIYNWECQNGTQIRLIGTWNGTVNGVESNLTQVVVCKYECTNLTQPAQCVISPATDTWTRPMMPMPIFILLQVVALIFFILGVVIRSEEGNAFLFLPLMSMLLFFTLAISAINIDGEFNLVMMLLNFGLGGLSLIFVFYELLTGGPVKQLVDQTL